MRISWPVVVLTVALVGAALARYDTEPTHQGLGLWLTDRWTGAVHLCRSGYADCIEMHRRDLPPFAANPFDQFDTQQKADEFLDTTE